jgi:ATP-binding cassette, subfamily F, member 3
MFLYPLPCVPTSSDRLCDIKDLEATIWLEGFLAGQSYTLVLTSHDRAFLDNVVEETVSLRNKKLHYFEGSPSAMELNAKKESRMLDTKQAALNKRKEHASTEPSIFECGVTVIPLD